MVFLLDLFYMHECVPQESLGVTDGCEPPWVVRIEPRFSERKSNKYPTTEPSLQQLTLGFLKVGASLTLCLESKGLHCFFLSLHLFIYVCACVCVCVRTRARLHTHHHAHTEEDGGNLQALALSFHQAGPGETWWQGDGHLIHRLVLRAGLLFRDRSDRLADFSSRMVWGIHYVTHMTAHNCL